MKKSSSSDVVSDHQSIREILCDMELNETVRFKHCHPRNAKLYITRECKTYGLYHCFHCGWSGRINLNGSYFGAPHPKVLSTYVDSMEYRLLNDDNRTGKSRTSIKAFRSRDDRYSEQESLRGATSILQQSRTDVASWPVSAQKYITIPGLNCIRCVVGRFPYYVSYNDELNAILFPGLIRDEELSTLWIKHLDSGQWWKPPGNAKPIIYRSNTPPQLMVFTEDALSAVAVVESTAGAAMGIAIGGTKMSDYMVKYVHEYALKAYHTKPIPIVVWLDNDSDKIRNNAFALTQQLGNYFNVPRKTILDSNVDPKFIYSNIIKETCDFYIDFLKKG